MEPPFLTTCCDTVDRAEITAVLFILKSPKVAQILQFLCFGWSICCPRNQLSPQAGIKNKLLSKQQISPSSQFHLPVYIMKEEFYTCVLRQSIHTTLHLPADLQTYHREALRGSKSLRGAETEMCLSPSSQRFPCERRNSFPFPPPQPGILIKTWILAKSLPPYHAGVDYFELILLCRNAPVPPPRGCSPPGKALPGRGTSVLGPEGIRGGGERQRDGLDGKAQRRGRSLLGHQ